MINSYAFGKIVIRGKEYSKDVIIFPDCVKANWWRKEGHKLHVEDIKEVLQEELELIVVGTGKFGLMKVLPETEQAIKERNIELIVEKTAEACKVYNTFSQEKRVVAALHLTC
jgi:hypothetical protein